jgi:glycine/D-amino acid oxidase-like deaminating enzyme
MRSAVLLDCPQRGKKDLAAPPAACACSAVDVSPWMAGEGPRTPSLRVGMECDALVVGAGYTGLSTAIALRELGWNVTVLEREYVGWGASGRNAGHLTPTTGKDLPTLARFFGAERARALAALVETAITHVEHSIAAWDLACDYEPVGNVIAAVHRRQHKTVDAAAAAAKDLGIPNELLDGDALRARGLPPTFTRGLHFPHGGVLDPGKYVLELARVASDAGVEIFERTPVVGVDDGRPVTVRTHGGHVRARLVVIATNAFTPELGHLRRQMIPVQVSLFRTAPLSDAQRAAVGWAGREGLYTAHEILESYRLTADQRIVGGSKRIRYGFGGRHPAEDPDTYDFIIEAFRARFPMLRDVEITECWSGPIAFALDFLPVVRPLGDSGNLYVSAGYAGHGVALASYAGRMIADLVTGETGPGAVLAEHWTPPLPPEPLRWLAVHGIAGALAMMDRRVDRAVRPA